jgi:membrane protein
MTPRSDALARLGAAPVLLVRRFVAHQGFLLAGALSYSFLLCLAPLVLLLSSAAGFVLQSDQLAEYALEGGTRLFPGYGHEVLQALAALTRERRVTGLLGAAGLMLFASQLFSLVRTVTNTAFEVPRRRGFVHGLTLDLLAVGALALVALVLSALMLVALTIGQLSRQLVPSLGVTDWISPAVAGLIYALLLALLFLVYRTSPNVPVPASAAMAATLGVAVFWEAARWGLTVYLARFGTYGQLYGSLGAVVAALVWVYYSAVIFVLGAEVAALVAGRDRSSPDGATAERPAPGGRARARLPLLVAGALASAAAVFAIQNPAPTTVRLLAWSVDALPLAVLVIVPAVVSGLAVALALAAGRSGLRQETERLRQRVRDLEKRGASADDT